MFDKNETLNFKAWPNHLQVLRANTAVLVNM